MKNLSRRFKHIILLYDMDATGIESSKKRMEELAAYKVKRLELPLSGSKTDKDISDFYANGHKTEELNKLLFNLLSSLARKTQLSIDRASLTLPIRLQNHMLS